MSWSAATRKPSPAGLTTTTASTPSWTRRAHGSRPNPTDTAPARSKAGRKAANMTKYDVKVMSLETGMTFTLEGRWESRNAMDEDLKKAGYVVIGCWTAFNQD